MYANIVFVHCINLVQQGSVQKTLLVVEAFRFLTAKSRHTPEILQHLGTHPSENLLNLDAPSENC